MATRKHRGIPLSSLNPKFLHTNSTSHTWPFSAIAELIDNAYDPDVRAKQFWVDWTRIKGLDCLSFMDNGEGMTRARLHKMLSFGYSDKKAVRDHVPVGIYGNGFKSGSMRLGKDAIVFTKTKDSMSIGLLSQSYLQAIKAQQIMVPILTFRRDGQNQAEDAASLEAILSHSLFSTEKELFSELRAIGAVGPTGTRVIIWNLRTTVSGETEFDFAADKYDIQIRASAGEKSREDRAMSAESEWSLRAYCSILYLKPRMQINIRGQRVKTQLISKSLAHIANDSYRPSFLTKRIRITFGFNTKSKEHCGIMMYHKNRLIKAYERVSCQRKAERKGIGVIGVIECNFLQPTHNKQDFDDTDQYRKTMYNLSIKLEDFWNEIRYKRKKEDPKCSVPIEDTMKVPDQVWVQCDSCLKWRRLPDGFDCSRLPEKWFCNLNHDPQFRSCLIEEELEDQEEEQKSYPKPFKRRTKRKHFSTEVRAAGVTPCTSVPPTALPQGASTFTHTEAMLTANTRETKWEVESDGRENSDEPVSSVPSGMAVRSEPVLEEEEEQGADTWHEMWAPEEVGGSDFKQEDVDGPCEEELEEETWTPKQPQEEELLERMREAMEDRDSCREEVEVLRGNCATLQDERSELLSTLRRVEQEKASLSSLCDQLKRELEKLRGNADKRAGPEGDDGPGAEDRRKLKKLRLRLARLLVCFMPALDLEHVDISSEVIDDLLDQVLEEVT
ncbi:MORC family CW-type zinc finger protein 3b isoform X5 [Brachyhypopomus gauderio]|uniref:MORC family CW-type zinc finger protein 3b isoform X5 n=1 Tax=Brachyhypopomus gauderio TaxID=698409 RepID=UPI0040421BE2